jgi:hypothetical protein
VPTALSVLYRGVCSCASICAEFGIRRAGNAIIKEEGHPMTRVALLGPHRLGFDEIETSVPRVRPGVYLLGHLDHKNAFYLKAIGRFDVDLQTGLRGLIGSGGHFKFQVAPTSRAAFEYECKLFHDLRPNSSIHPVRSENKDWTCPYCRSMRDVHRGVG